jgi:hypothetical protein
LKKARTSSGPTSFTVVGGSQPDAAVEKKNKPRNRRDAIESPDFCIGVVMMLLASEII